jgi:hypothetical protein
VKSKKQIDAELERLLKIVNAKANPVEARVAYITHEAIRWATLNTRGWKRPSAEIPDNARFVIRAVGELRGQSL